MSMITSQIIQAAAIALDELHTSETDAEKAVAQMGVGPRALGRFVQLYGDLYTADQDPREQVEIATMAAFLTGVVAARFASALAYGDTTPFYLLLAEEDNEVALTIEDAQDILYVLFGVETPEDISSEDLTKTLMTHMLGDALADDSAENDTAMDPIDPDGETE